MKFLIFLLLCGIFIAFIVINIYVNKHKKSEVIDENAVRLKNWRTQRFGSKEYFFGNIYGSLSLKDGDSVRLGPVSSHDPLLKFSIMEDGLVVFLDAKAE